MESTLTSTSAMKAAAEAALDKGFYVFALAPGTKIPRPGSHGHLDASANPGDIEKLWNENPEYNPAVSCAASGLIVLDYDAGSPPPEIDSIRTFKVRTSRGVHVYFWGQMPGTKLYDAIGNKVGEIKSSDGYVLAAGARHPSGAIYTAIDDSPVAEAPMNLIAKLTKKPASENRPIDDQGPIFEGEREKVLVHIAGRLRRAGASQPVIEVALREENLRCRPPLEEKAILRMAKSTARYEKESDQPTVLIGGRDPESGGQVTPPSSSTQGTSSVSPADWRNQFATVDELESGDVRMLIKNILPEGTTFVGALPGRGKSLLCLSLTKALTTGRPFVGAFEVPEKIPVLYLIPESGGKAFRQRLTKFGIPADPNLFLCRTISQGPTLRLSSDLILEAVRHLKPVVTLDTVIRFSESNDENSAAQNKQLCNDIIALRQAGAIAVIGVHHSPKTSANEEPSLENCLRGSGDIAALADCVIHVKQEEIDGEMSLRITNVKDRDFQPPLPFRLIARTKGPDGQIISKIDTTGDFEFVDFNADAYNKETALARAINDNPTATILDLAERLNISRNKIPGLARKLGWEHKAKRGPWTRIIVGDPSSPTSFDDEDEDDQQDQRGN